MVQVVAKGGLAPRCPGAGTCVVRASTTRRPGARIEDGEGAAAPRSATDSTEQWVWCFYAHAVYVICYFCYMLFNVHLCMHIIPL